MAATGQSTMTLFLLFTALLGLSPLAAAGIVEGPANPDVAMPGMRLGVPGLPLPPGSNANGSQSRARREPTVGQRCIPVIQLGAGQRSATANCDGIHYKIWFPARSTCGDNNQRSSCGLIFDIPGATMSADNQNAGSRLRLHGRNAGYIVVNPEDSNRWWEPATDHAKIADFLRQSIAAFQPNRRKVHVTGFSQGGFATWRMLDLASDVVCSIAPLASSGRDRWGDGYIGNPSSFATGRRGPPTPRSIMYHTGTADLLAAFSYFRPQVDAVLSNYGIARSSGRRMAGSDSDNTRTLYTGRDGVTVQTGQFDYWTFAENGHCFPSTRSSTSANQKGCYAWPGLGDYDWGPEVVRFFRANKCPASSPTPPPSSPPPPPAEESPFTSYGGRVEYFLDDSCSNAISTTQLGGPFCTEQLGLANVFSFAGAGVACSDDRQTAVVAAGHTYDNCIEVATMAMASRSSQYQISTGAVAGVTANGACVYSGSPGFWTKTTCLARPREEYTGIAAVRGGRMQIFDDPRCTQPRQRRSSTAAEDAFCAGDAATPYWGGTPDREIWADGHPNGGRRTCANDQARFSSYPPDAVAHIRRTCCSQQPAFSGNTIELPGRICDNFRPNFMNEIIGAAEWAAVCAVDTDSDCGAAAGRHIGLACDDGYDSVLACSGTSAECCQNAAHDGSYGEDCGCHIVTPDTCIDLGNSNYVRYSCTEVELTAMPTAPETTPAPTPPLASFTEDGGTVQWYAGSECDGPVLNNAPWISDLGGDRCMVRDGLLPWSNTSRNVLGMACQPSNGNSVVVCHSPDVSLTQAQCQQTACGIEPIDSCYAGGNHSFRLVCSDDDDNDSFNPCPQSFTPNVISHYDCNIPLDTHLTRQRCENDYGGHYIDTNFPDNRCIARLVDGAPIGSNDALCQSIGGQLYPNTFGSIVQIYYSQVLRHGCNATLPGRGETYISLLEMYSAQSCGLEPLSLDLRWVCGETRPPTVAPRPLTEYTVNGGVLQYFHDATCTTPTGDNVTLDQGGVCSLAVPRGSSNPLAIPGYDSYTGVQCTPDGFFRGCSATSVDSCLNAANGRPVIDGGCHAGDDGTVNSARSGVCYFDEDNSRYLRFTCASAPTAGVPTTRAPATRAPATGAPTARAPTTRAPTSSWWAPPTAPPPTTTLPTTSSPTAGRSVSGATSGGDDGGGMSITALVAIIVGIVLVVGILSLVAVYVMKAKPRGTNNPQLHGQVGRQFTNPNYAIPDNGLDTGPGTYECAVTENPTYETNI